MPTYEYACAACAHEWETVQRITEAPIDVCPKCAKSAAHRLISAGTNFILKGGGWYSDLYASPKAASKVEASDAAPAGGEKPAGKSDVKADSSGGGAAAPEAKPAAKAAPAVPSGNAPSSSPST